MGYADIQEKFGKLQMIKLTDILREVYSDFRNQVLFHGTKSKFSKFDLRFFNAGSGDGGWLGHGIYLTNDYEYAESYGDVLECKVSCNKPYIITDDSYQKRPEALANDLGVSNSREITNVLKSRGHDSVLLTYDDVEGWGDVRGDKFIEVCVFNPGDITIIG